MDFSSDWFNTYRIRSEPIAFGSHVWFTSDDLRQSVELIISKNDGVLHSKYRFYGAPCRQTTIDIEHLKTVLSMSVHKTF